MTVTAAEAERQFGTAVGAELFPQQPSWRVASEPALCVNAV